MQRQVIAVLVLIGLVTACRSGGPTPLPVSPTPLPASPTPEIQPASVASSTSTPTAPPAPTEPPTLTVGPANVATPTPEVQPASLSLVGHIGGYANTVAVAAETAGFVYAGIGPELAVVDVSDPIQPTRTGYVVSSEIVRDVAVQGGYAYVAVGEAGLQVVDVSDVRAPAVVASVDVPGSAGSVAVAGERVYVADGPNQAVRVFEVADPRAPVEIDVIETELAVRCVVAAGDYLYVIGGQGENGRLDILYLGEEADHATRRTVTFDAEAIRDVAVVGPAAYVVGRDLRVLNVNHARTAVPMGVGEGLGGEAIVTAGTRAYIAAGDEGLRVVDITDSAAPVELARVALPGYAVGVSVRDVAASAQVAYVAAEGSGLHVVDVAVPTAPVLVGTLPAPGYPVSIRPLDAAPGHLMVADGVGRLSVVDVSAPAAPAQVGTFPLRGIPGDVAVAGSLAFVADQLTPGVEIVDLSSVAQPAGAGFLELPAPAFGVAADANRVLVADGYTYVDGEPTDGGLRIVDVAAPTAPTETGFWDMPGEGVAVAMDDSIAFAGGSDSGLRLIDVQNPAQPVELGAVVTRGPVTGIDVRGDYVYVTDGWGESVRIVDIADLQAPAEVGFYYVRGLADGIAAVSDSYVFVTDWTEGVHVLDVADPAAPHEIAWFQVPGSAMAVVVAGEQVYVAAGDGGLFTLLFTPSQRTVQPAITPEPLAAAPPSGAYRPQDEFADLWSADDLIQRSLGWALEAEPSSVYAAVQRFEGGLMIWREDNRQIYTLYADGSWTAVDDTWTEDQPAFDPAITAPADRFQPIRGFGKVWRNNRQVRGRVGWALEPERGVNVTVQPFQHGGVIEVEEEVYALVADSASRRMWYRR